jgi:hypothetical protein
MLQQNILAVKTFFVFVLTCRSLYKLLSSVSAWIIYCRRLKFKENGCKEPISRTALEDPFSPSPLYFRHFKMLGTSVTSHAPMAHDRFKKYRIADMSKHVQYPTIHTGVKMHLHYGIVNLSQLVFVDHCP